MVRWISSRSIAIAVPAYEFCRWFAQVSIYLLIVMIRHGSASDKYSVKDPPSLAVVRLSVVMSIPSRLPVQANNRHRTSIVKWHVQRTGIAAEMIALEGVSLHQGRLSKSRANR